MKIALFGSNQLQFSKVYTEEVLVQIKKLGEITPRINKKNIEIHKELLKDCEIAFATWGMPVFTKTEIKKYMPSLKAVFYSAGTVQYFARPFLESGIKIFSAYAANAVPVAEFTFALISLASKGYFQAAKNYRILPLRSFVFANTTVGNFGCKVGLIGLGAIGQAVAKKLGELDVEIFAYDPFVSRKKAEELNVSLVSLEEIFSTCDIISNHLANKPELKNIFNYSLFKKMKNHSTFINTGRGAQVSEYQLALKLLLHPSVTFIGDVLKTEYFPYINPLFWCHNAILTPHIAGSTGKEPQRMAYYMIEEAKAYLSGKDTKYEVTAEALDRMA